MPSNQLARLARISIHDRIMLGHHFDGLLKAKKAKSQMAIGREYGVSPSWVRSICEIVKLAPNIQERIGEMTEAEAEELLRFRDLFNISQSADHQEQMRRFNEMIEPAFPR